MPGSCDRAAQAGVSRPVHGMRGCDRSRGNVGAKDSRRTKAGWICVHRARRVALGALRLMFPRWRSWRVYAYEGARVPVISSAQPGVELSSQRLVMGAAIEMEQQGSCLNLRPLSRSQLSRQRVTEPRRRIVNGEQSILWCPKTLWRKDRIVGQWAGQQNHAVQMWPNDLPREIANKHVADERLPRNDVVDVYIRDHNPGSLREVERLSCHGGACFGSVSARLSGLSGSASFPACQHTKTAVNSVRPHRNPVNQRFIRRANDSSSRSALSLAACCSLGLVSQRTAARSCRVGLSVLFVLEWWIVCLVELAAVIARPRYMQQERQSALDQRQHDSPDEGYRHLTSRSLDGRGVSSRTAEQATRAALFDFWEWSGSESRTGSKRGRRELDAPDDL